MARKLPGVGHFVYCLVDGNAWWSKLKPVGAGQHLLVGPKSGQQFSRDNFSRYVKSMFKKHTGVAVNAHLLRDVVVTELLDRQAPMALRGAYAVSMGQSLETQISILIRQKKSSAANRDCFGGHAATIRVVVSREITRSSWH